MALSRMGVRARSASSLLIKLLNDQTPLKWEGTANTTSPGAEAWLALISIADSCANDEFISFWISELKTTRTYTGDHRDVAKSLVRIGPTAVDQLVRLLNSDDPHSMRAWSILCGINDPRTQEERSNHHPLHGKGEFTDSRDQTKYETVTIGSQTWMARNLNFRPPKGHQSWCYDNDSVNCPKFGRLYDWWSANGACPVGWHLPSNEEWNQLETEIGYGHLLRSTSWGGGSDAVSFHAIRSGHRNRDGIFDNSYAQYWSSSVYGNRVAYANVSSDYTAIMHHYASKDEGLSVRCIKDNNLSTKPNTQIIQRPDKAPPSSQLGKMTDPRDGTVYNTTVIGNQIWMAQNLAYAVGFFSGGSCCLDDDPSNCTRYGRLYRWSVARKACPSGWHLPSSEEWRQLKISVGSGAGKSLKSLSWGGTNTYGFDILPSGRHYPWGNFSEHGADACFWSSSETDSSIIQRERHRALGPCFRWDDDRFLTSYDDKKSGYSVRCLKD